MSAPKFSKKEVSQTIDLEEVFGVKIRGNRALKEAFGQAVIDKMLARTEDGKGMSFGSSGRGTPVKLKSPYSKQYTDSLDFKAAGKSPGKVNMRLTGDMLGSMDVTEIKGSKIKIGFDGGEENAKSFNHCTGDTVPKRPFFGCNRAELKALAREFSSDIRELKAASGSERQEIILGLIDKLTGGDEDAGES